MFENISRKNKITICALTIELSINEIIQFYDKVISSDDIISFVNYVNSSNDVFVSFISS